MKPARAIHAGLWAAAAMTAAAYAAPFFALPETDFAGLMAYVFMDETASSGTPMWWFGMILHFTLGTLVFPLVYAAWVYPHLAGRPWLRGLSWGIVLWLLFLVVAMPAMGMGIFASLSPRPVMTALTLLVAHAIYGLVLGVLAGAQVLREEKEEETWPYNYPSFRRAMLKQDLQFSGGPRPGDAAPGFDLPTVSGGRFKLSAFRGIRPVLLEFGSITCPMTAAAREPLRKLHDAFGSRVQFVTVYVREAHPGENFPHHTDEPQKLRQARAWKEIERVPWSVVTDSLEGRVHNTYGPLPNSVYLIDSSGHVAFRALFAGQEGLLREKLEELLRRESSHMLPVNLGEQRNLLLPMLSGAGMIDHAIRRAGKRAEDDFRREMGNVIYGLEKLISRMKRAA